MMHFNARVSSQGKGESEKKKKKRVAKRMVR